jgi:predicted regulator of Ras-like GTPase activity (Roadblock/LC7/MglB family)
MLKEILGEFLNIDGVSAAVMVGRDGLVIESVTPGKMDIDELGKGEPTQIIS